MHASPIKETVASQRISFWYQRDIRIDFCNTYFGFMNTVQVDSEEWVWNHAMREACRIGETTIDDHYREYRKWNIKAELSEASIGIQGPNDAISIPVPENHMLL